MIHAHLRERFFQRYGLELTPVMMAEIVYLAIASTVREPDAFLQGRERVWVNWKGRTIGLSWSKANRYVVTFLPTHARIGQKPPKAGARR